MSRGITKTLRAAGLYDVLPTGGTINTKVVGDVPAGTTVADAHRNWRREHVGRVTALPPFPWRDTDEIVPDRTQLVEVEVVERRSGGMSSHYGFEGVFVSLLVSRADGSIWDARTERAS